MFIAMNGHSLSNFCQFRDPHLPPPPDEDHSKAQLSTNPCNWLRFLIEEPLGLLFDMILFTLFSEWVIMYSLIWAEKGKTVEEILTQQNRTHSEMRRPSDEYKLSIRTRTMTGCRPSDSALTRRERVLNRIYKIFVVTYSAQFLIFRFIILLIDPADNNDPNSKTRLENFQESVSYILTLVHVISILLMIVIFIDLCRLMKKQHRYEFERNKKPLFYQFMIVMQMLFFYTVFQSFLKDYFFKETKDGWPSKFCNESYVVLLYIFTIFNWFNKIYYGHIMILIPTILWAKSS